MSELGRRQPLEDTLPWYRQFWPWFLISLPAATVVAGLITLYLAASGSDSLVKDDYYKHGLAINQDLARVNRARELGIEADLSYDPLKGVIRVTAARVAVDMQQMSLRLTHATRSDLDQAVTLDRQPNAGFEASVLPLGPGKWHVDLLPASAEWRLSGRLSVPEQTRLELR
jgi:hypothetical protein